MKRKYKLFLKDILNLHASHLVGSAVAAGARAWHIAPGIQAPGASLICLRTAKE